MSFALVVGLLAAEAHRRADVMAALADQRGLGASAERFGAVPRMRENGKETA